MDLASNSKHEYVLKDGPAHTVTTGSVDSSSEQLEQLLDEVPELQERELVVVVEATGMSWFPIAVFFQQKEIPLYRVKAQKSEEFRDFISRYAKTDELDADSLARLYYTIPDQLHQVWLPLGDLHSLRRWVKRREDYLKMFTAEKDRLSKLLKFTLPSLKGKLDRFMGKKMWNILARAVDFRWACTHMGEERFIQWAQNRNSGIDREQLEDLYEIIEEAKKLYKDSDHDPEGLSEEAQELAEHLHELSEKINKVEEKMQELNKKVFPDKSVESIPGVAWKSACAAKSYLGNGSRFPNINKTEAFLGAIPETDQSGDTDKQGTNIRKDGPSILRKYLYMAANTARLWDPQIAKTYHDQMVNKGKVHTQAICKCMNKLLRRIMRVLDDGEEYELRDNDDNPVDQKQARQIINKNYTVPKKIRRRRRNKIESS